MVSPVPTEPRQKRDKKVGRTIGILALLFLLVGLFPWPAHGQGSTPRFFRLTPANGLVGQSAIGASASNNYGGCLGYWCGITRAVGVQYRIYLPLVMRGF